MRPLIPFGFALNNIAVKRRIFSEDGCEIYELENGEFLHILPASICASEAAKELILDGQKYRAIVKKDSDLAGLLKRADKSGGLASVAGMDELKKILMRDVIGAWREPKIYAKFGVGLPNGILLYGPPGCGKTFIASKIADELGFNFIEVRHSDIASEYIHGTVKMIGELFKRAKEHSPCVLFFDELDGIAPKRSKAYHEHKIEEINELLMNLNNIIDYKVLVIAATNQIELIDEAVLRPGRFDKKILVAPPDLRAREALFEYYLAKKPLGSDISVAELASLTEGCSCVEIKLVCEEAARDALFNAAQAISMEHFKAAIRGVSDAKNYS